MDQAPDPVSAKKRLTSRSTRYSGVLDMLNIEEGDPTDLGQLEVRHACAFMSFYCL
jgi:hypothetical protein